MEESEHIFDYYDVERGWSETNKGWYTAKIEDTVVKKHAELVIWVLNNISKPDKHVRWIWMDIGNEYNASIFKFRYERDYVLFTLRWS